MSYLYLKADIYPDLSKQEQAKAAFQELIKHSLAEPGCLLYDLVVDDNNPTVWHMFEKWESKEVWDKHMTSDHVAKIQQLEESLLIAPTKLNFYEPVGF